MCLYIARDDAQRQKMLDSANQQQKTPLSEVLLSGTGTNDGASASASGSGSSTSQSTTTKKVSYYLVNICINEYLSKNNLRASCQSGQKSSKRRQSR